MTKFTKHRFATINLVYLSIITFSYCSEFNYHRSDTLNNYTKTTNITHNALDKHQNQTKQASTACLSFSNEDELFLKTKQGHQNTSTLSGTRTPGGWNHDKLGCSFNVNARDSFNYDLNTFRFSPGNAFDLTADKKKQSQINEPIWPLEKGENYSYANSNDTETNKKGVDLVNLNTYHFSTRPFSEFKGGFLDFNEGMDEKKITVLKNEPFSSFQTNVNDPKFEYKKRWIPRDTKSANSFERGGSLDLQHEKPKLELCEYQDQKNQHLAFYDSSTNPMWFGDTQNPIKSKHTITTFKDGNNEGLVHHNISLVVLDLSQWNSAFEGSFEYILETMFFNRLSQLKSRIEKGYIVYRIGRREKNEIIKRYENTGLLQFISGKNERLIDTLVFITHFIDYIYQITDIGYKFEINQNIPENVFEKIYKRIKCWRYYLQIDEYNLEYRFKASDIQTMSRFISNFLYRVSILAHKKALIDHQILHYALFLEASKKRCSISEIKIDLHFVKVCINKVTDFLITQLPVNEKSLKVSENEKRFTIYPKYSTFFEIALSPLVHMNSGFLYLKGIFIIIKDLLSFFLCYRTTGGMQKFELDTYSFISLDFHNFISREMRSTMYNLYDQNFLEIFLENLSDIFVPTKIFLDIIKLISLYNNFASLGSDKIKNLPLKKRFDYFDEIVGCYFIETIQNIPLLIESCRLDPVNKSEILDYFTKVQEDLICKLNEHPQKNYELPAIIQSYVDILNEQIKILSILFKTEAREKRQKNLFTDRNAEICSKRFFYYDEDAIKIIETMKAEKKMTDINTFCASRTNFCLDHNYKKCFFVEKHFLKRFHWHQIFGFLLSSKRIKSYFASQSFSFDDLATK